MIIDLFDMEKIRTVFDNTVIYLLQITSSDRKLIDSLSLINDWTSSLTLSISYGLFALLLIYYIFKKKPNNYKIVIYCIIGLIFFYGLEHFIEVCQVWHGWYPITAILKLINAGFSWVIVIYCLIILPDLKKIAFNIETRKLFDSILAKIPTAVILLDANLHIIQINPAVEKLFIRTSKQLYNIHIFDLFCVDSCQYLKDFFDGTVHDHPHILTAILGTPAQNKKVSATVECVEDVDHGKYLMTLIDVTQEELSRLAISKRQREIETVLAYKQAIFYNMQDGVITLTSDGVIERMNPKAEEILGCKFIDMKDHYISEIMALATHLPQNTIKQKIAEVEEHLQQHNLHISQEYAIKSTDSSVKTIEIIVSSMDIAGEKRYCMILHDITARKKYEQELKSNEELLNQITANIDAMIWIADPITQKIIYRSQSFHRLFGTHSKEDFSNEHINFHLIHEDDREQVRRDIFKEGAKGPWRQIFRVIRPCGELRYFSISSVNLTSIKDNSPKMAGILLDVTELIEAKQALEYQKDELSQKCDELNNRNDKLDTFAHIIAHDLKAPLFAISNLSSWLKEDCSDLIPPQSQEHLELLLKRASDMNNLLDDIFDYFFKSAIGGKNEKQVWKKLIDDILYTIQIPRGLRIIDETGLTIIHTNKILLRQVLSNLITNAVKYHHQPEQGHVYIRCHEDAQYYRFSIVDDGPGISPRYFNDIFKPLTKLQSRDEVEGSGMGLAIVKKIVVQQGGQVIVDSTEGRGSNFTFTWPKSDENS